MLGRIISRPQQRENRAVSHPELYPLGPRCTGDTRNPAKQGSFKWRWSLWTYYTYFFPYPSFSFFGYQLDASVVGSSTSHCFLWKVLESGVWWLGHSFFYPQNTFIPAWMGWNTRTHFLVENKHSASPLVCLVLQFCQGGGEEDASAKIQSC